MELPSVPSQELADSGQVEKRVRVAEKRLLLLANHLHHRLEGAEGRGVLPAAVWSLGTGGEHTSATRTQGEAARRLHWLCHAGGPGAAPLRAPAPGGARIAAATGRGEDSTARAPANPAVCPVMNCEAKRCRGHSGKARNVRLCPRRARLSGGPGGSAHSCSPLGPPRAALGRTRLTPLTSFRCVCLCRNDPSSVSQLLVCT